MVKKFISYYKPYKKLFFLDLLAAITVSACDLIYPMLSRVAVNNFIPNKNYKSIITLGIFLFGIYIIKLFCNYFMNYWGHVVGVRMQSDMRKDIYVKLQNFPIKYFDNTQTGSIMSRIVNDLQEVSELAHHGPEDLFISIIMILGSFFLLLNINIPLTLIIFSVIPFTIWFTINRRQKMSDAFLETREKIGTINSTLQNSISGIRVSKAFVNKDEELEKFKVSNSQFKKARESAYKVMAEYISGMTFFTDMLDYLVLVFGAIFTYQGKINFGDFLAYLLYIRIFSQPIKRLVGFVEQYQNGMSGFKRFKDMLDQDIEKDSPNAINLTNVKGNITLENVYFSHDKKIILKNFTLNIKAGETLALVGPSGGGKTTICNLIPRFYDIDSGDIKIDSQSIYNFKIDSLRQNIGIVQQDPFLFTGTIKDNLTIGKPDASDEEIIEAATKANIHDFIETLPKGYNTEVGERGVKLSGGQKQRIAIGRIFLKNPPILILDEATSALDNITEQLIQESLDELSKNRTTIVVAHRLSTVKNADTIVVITDDGIVEKGTHEELINNKGFYYNLHLGILQ
ncbi:ABC transporter ATP-binding protein [Candidatus Cetobacterium colombiensis]|uniref:ABC transporter ATP-binding protein n=1 Tax=Candidatus Cetobacterium colombiensis TaxID=3073100 RepID=A0ABU4W891_9FUSO|nr:ABC transporter ATP-binding protein [Candidatus Cetobacterium colombiensis]MDX8335257.1 ABC transporter ATP-binding protein [Candidatus Cetobacterium colombiensis]